MVGGKTEKSQKLNVGEQKRVGLDQVGCYLSRQGAGQYILQHQVLQHLLGGGINRLITSLLTHSSVATLSARSDWLINLIGSLTRKSTHTLRSKFLITYQIMVIEILEF